LSPGWLLNSVPGCPWVKTSVASKNAQGTEATSEASAQRDDGRNWRPVHPDVVVLDLETALRRALAAGATLDREVQVRPWGRMAKSFRNRLLPLGV
jgi:Glyoxalase-like domain